ncbi:MAG: helix-turn-helix domain-containing protein [Muribaculaceae bacterium]|nr:helix-turn-helix domain-containing protein [Muribaculaceae bacterium]
MPIAKYRIKRKCVVCGTEFIAKNIDSIHCSRKCSNVAYRKRKKQEKEEERQKSLKKSIPNKRQFISVKEALLLYNVGRNTIYRLIQAKLIPAINLGTRLIRLDRQWIEERFSHKAKIQQHVTTKTYCLEPDCCYTIGEVTERFHVSPSTVYTAVRKYSIPMRQIGKYVYVPKDEVNNIFSK